jgi:hypothetical protein
MVRRYGCGANGAEGWQTDSACPTTECGRGMVCGRVQQGHTGDGTVLGSAGDRDRGRHALFVRGAMPETYYEDVVLRPRGTGVATADGQYAVVGTYARRVWRTDGSERGLGTDGKLYRPTTAVRRLESRRGCVAGLLRGAATVSEARIETGG